MGPISFAIIFCIAYVCQRFTERLTKQIDLEFTEKMIDNIGGVDRLNNQETMVGRIDLHDKMEGKEQIQKLLGYLNYEEQKTPDKKYVYAINNSKV